MREFSVGDAHPTGLQGVNSVFDITWQSHPEIGQVKYGQVHHQGEVEHSHYNFGTKNKDSELL